MTNYSIQPRRWSFVVVVFAALVALAGLSFTAVYAQTDLTGTEWQWISWTDVAAGGTDEIPDPGNYTLTFYEDGTIDGQADCNQFSGTYVQDAVGLDLQVNATTRAACPEGSLDQVYLDALNNVVAGGPDGTGNLALETAGAAQRMVFAPATAAVLDDTAGLFAGEFLGLPWWLWLLLGVILIGLLIWWLMSRSQPQTSPPPPPVRAPVQPERVAPATKDDLSRIEGIGPRIEAVLNDAGIYTYLALSNTMVDRLNQILANANLTGAAADPTTWPAQARLAAEGRWEELAVMQAEIKGGRMT